MKNLKIDLVKVLGLTGTALGIVATLVSNIAQKKQMQETITKEVAKALENQ